MVMKVESYFFLKHSLQHGATVQYAQVVYCVQSPLKPISSKLWHRMVWMVNERSRWTWHNVTHIMAAQWWHSSRGAGPFTPHSAVVEPQRLEKKFNYLSTWAKYVYECACIPVQLWVCGVYTVWGFGGEIKHREAREGEIPFGGSGS